MLCKDWQQWVGDMVRWPPALSATSTQNTARTNCLQMSHAEGEGACVHANQCLVFSFFCVWLCGGGDFPLPFKLWAQAEAPIRLALGTRVHTRTKASLCLTLVDKQEGQAGASFLGCWERRVRGNEYLSTLTHTLPSVQLLFASSSSTSLQHVVTTVIPAVFSAFVIINPTPCWEAELLRRTLDSLRQGFALWLACYIGFMFIL